ncbi:MAG: GTPase Era [Acidimicrobiia bacterium]|nr:GTPase Era [Acidimicrobiia bacterium]
MKSGFVAVVGRPNVGKSTLVNQMVGTKVSITSSRPQTTRNAIRGVVSGPDPNDPEYQIVLVDTPGLHRPRTELGHRLNATVSGSLRDADMALFVIDATMPIGPGDRLIAQRLSDSKARVVTAVNKVDLASRSDVISQLSKAGEWDFDEYFAVSAASGQGVPDLVAAIASRLDDGPMYFPSGTTTDQPEGFVIGEVIREKFLDRLRQELPHSLLVRVQEIEERSVGVNVAADVVVERASQKGIVIGSGAGVLRDAGTEARSELERILGTKVHLDLRVVVEKDWQRRPQLLDRLGFKEGDHT